MPEGEAAEEEFEARVEQVTRAVSELAGANVERERLDAVVREVVGELHNAPVQDFIALLAERIVGERLRQWTRP